jgi:small subunit ribosomal protein S11
MAQAKRKDKAKKRVVIVEPVGQVHIRATFNNIIISITNMNGQVISWASAGKMGFRGSKKNTPYAAQTAASNCAAVAHDLGMRKAEVFVKGPGSGRESAIRTYSELGNRGNHDSRYYPYAAQRLPAPQASSCITRSTGST